MADNPIPRAKSFFEPTDRRHIRAHAFVMMLLHEIRDCLPDPDDRAYREIEQRLYRLSFESGIEIMTDFMRQDAGLPPRGPNGWTTEELIAYEKAMLDAIYKPRPPITVKHDPNMPEGTFKIVGNI